MRAQTPPSARIGVKGFFAAFTNGNGPLRSTKKRRTQVTRSAASGRALATSEKLGAKARVDVIAAAKCDAHSPFDGSVATRVLRCPASVRLVANVPAHLRKPSLYADRGTACHTAMALLIENKCSFDDLVGATIDNYTFPRDDIEKALRPAYAYVDALLDAPGAAYYREQRVKFPTIAGAFGTADLVARVGNVIHVVDFKFGSGVRVIALYPDGDEDIINAQLLFYAAAARHSFPEFFAGVEDIVLAIVQPMAIELVAEMVSTVRVAHAELDEFITFFREAREEARAPEPRLERGDHCRFCPARPLCPAHTGPLLDLAQFTVPTPATGNYLALLAAGLETFTSTRSLATCNCNAALGAKFINFRLTRWGI